MRPSFRPDHVDLFDGVLTSLVPHAELAARAELAERLSLLVNAPRGLVGQLAHEDEIAIAGPLLRRSPVIDEQVLVEIARVKGQGHLLAMAERPSSRPISPTSSCAAATATWSGAPPAMRARRFRRTAIRR